MSTPNLIGLTGRAGTGKDTIGAELVALGYERVAFADPIRAAAYASDPHVAVPLPDGGATVVRLSGYVDRVGWEEAKKSPDVRRYLQRYAAALRDVDPELWLIPAVKAAGAAHRRGVPVVVTDVRSPDEVKLIRTYGGVVVRLWRIDAPDLGANGQHVTEQTGDLDVDLDVANNGPAAPLAAFLDGWATDMRGTG